MKTAGKRWIAATAIALGGIGCSGAPAADRQTAAAAPLESSLRPSHGTAPVVEAAVMWLAEEGETGRDEAFAGMTIPVQGHFPADFTLSVSEPPPEPAFLRSPSLEELVGDTGLKLAIGTLVAAREGRLSEVPITVPPGWESDDSLVLGEDEDWVLVYLNQDVQPGPLSDELFGGATPTAGYHLFGGAEIVEAPEGLNTRLNIVLRDPR